MARPHRTFVAEIGSELALPMAWSYCTRHRLSYQRECGEDMWWAGAFVHGALRGVMGFSSLGPMGMLVCGVFHDDSPDHIAASRMFVERLIDLPCDLYGSLHLPTECERRLFRKSGWDLYKKVVG